ncbi:hypothetical protein BABINDRAFT_148069 [Babjeviella inositovora NRRL Y-12698]|uniref:CNNM transmembrane domain-containing protein n=1 Tax=Babjeviella inositovora NRRL Y-12698 TaxID=984486 RepID=A0A1E3QQ68_9ASCO|nr:uncharacterized protein BABINDRAFT_148069 [Babjeviella inositovora NRRL Y-12698]ODQ79107.1 hypothetical protein BABINDRAFT_148069 [Babjeviella inositovora NRRL Y-12698]
MLKPSIRNVNTPRTAFLGSNVSRLSVLVSTLPKLVKGIPVALVSSVYTQPDSQYHLREELSESQYITNLLFSALLVILGGIFAGLTLGLMGQDEVYLKVMASSGEDSERRHAKRVLDLIGRGKHWVLVTLLLSNVITNESLPIVLDSVLGGGWPAVVASTVSIVIFGEVIPQSVCVRYGLQVGSMCAPFVLGLMYVMYPVAYPIAMLLDYVLGEDHGTVYKKSGLKTLVTLHRTMGVERLNLDEVTIISAVLDLKEKPVGTIMTPMESVFTMPADTILDTKIVEDILHKGFSRIPIYVPGQPKNFIGMLLVRVLISYDPDDELPVSSFPLATLPETSPETSCLNILNYFQEGKSHMIVISANPGDSESAMGILTLEDVIEELIGEEIIDESDVYIDINNAIKRTQPGPLAKRSMTHYLHHLYTTSRRSSVEGNCSSKTHSTSLPNHPLLSAPQPKFVSDDGHGNSLLNTLFRPINPAANPIESSKKAFVHIKSPSHADEVFQVLPPPQQSTGGEGYGAVHVTEDGAVAEQLARRHDEAPVKQTFSTSENRDSTDLTDFDHNQTEVPIVKGGLAIPQTEFLTSHTYKTGGIIESVVNIRGVHKTIIENVSDDEYSDENGSAAFTSGDESERFFLNGSVRKASPRWVN